MNDNKDVEQLLRSAFESVAAAERDRWPQMSRRLDRRPLAIPWFEWAMGAVALALLVFTPAAVPILLNWL